MNAFVGLVVTELSRHDVSWCIPSRRLCQFFPELRVRFRIPPADRPVIHDYETDDPNLELFGNSSEQPHRSLLAKVTKRDGCYDVRLIYECPGVEPRGPFATFITYPNFTQSKQDAYELFAEVSKIGIGKWVAKMKMRASGLFTVAAIGDGGDTALTLDLDDVYRRDER